MVVTTPEPGTLWLFGFALLGMILVARHSPKQTTTALALRPAFRDREREAQADQERTGEPGL